MSNEFGKENYETAFKFKYGVKNNLKFFDNKSVLKTLVDNSFKAD